jgi:tetratricopeptide (TPR) repeat protein
VGFPFASFAAGLSLLAGAAPVASADDPLSRTLERADKLSSFQERHSDLAIPLYRQAAARAGRAGDRRNESRAWIGLGAALASTHRQREAQVSVERGRRLAREAGDATLEGKAVSMLGMLQIEAGEYEAADSLFTAALDLNRRAGDEAGEVRALNSLAASARRQGRLREAVELARRALGRMDGLLAKGTVLAPQSLFSVPYNLGKALADEGDFEAGMLQLQRALEGAERTGNLAGQWHVLHDTAEWYEAQGDSGRARRYYERALVQARLIESRDPEAITLRGLGSVAEAQGDLETAWRRQTEALALFESIGYRSELAATLTALGRVQHKMGRRQEAATNLARALSMASAQRQPLGEVMARIETARQARAVGARAEAANDYAAALRLARENGLRPLESMALTQMAALALEEDHPADARGLFEQSARVLEAIRGAVPSVELRVAFASATEATYDGLFEATLRLHDREPGRGHDGEALLVLERERAQNLMRALREAGAEEPRVASGGAAEERGLYRRVATLQTRLASTELDPARRAELLGRLDDAERDLDAQEGRRRPRASWGIPTALGPLQASLAPGEAFLEYEATPSGLFAFVVTRDRLRLVRRPPVDDLGARVDFFARMLSGEAPEEALPAGRALARVLVEPVLAALPVDTHRLIVSAGGELAGLPFAALPDPRTDGRPLLAGYEIAHAGSLSALAVLRGRPRPDPSRDLLAVTSPETGGDPLPSGGREVEKLLPVLTRAERLAGRAATEVAFKALPLRDFKVVHFATHAVLDPEVPSRSAILLTPGDGEDGRLQPREIYGLDLGADLVVLAACQTAVGRSSGGEGVQGLARAFTYAGAQAVVGTLWRVEDSAAAQLLGRMYSALGRGVPVAAALRQAQLEAAGERPYARARDWAGFVLIGDPATRPWIGSASPRVPRATIIAIGLGGLGIAALLAAAWHRRRRIGGGGAIPRRA